MTEQAPIAVVGIAGVFPGAPDLATFWRNIVDRVETAAEVPDHRWISPVSDMVRTDPMPDKAYGSRACLMGPEVMAAVDRAAADLPLDRDLLAGLDPMHRIALCAGKGALEDCAMDPVDRSRVGVVLAAIALPTDAASAISREILGGAFSARVFGGPPPGPIHWRRYPAGRVTSLPGALLCRALGLGAGSFTLDAACASSLYAVKLACDELLSGRADAMVAGGVSRPECLYTQVGFSQLRALSPSGRCAPFDRSADGLVVGEGAGIMVLKRLDDARAHGDRIYGVIRGIGLSNDMRGNLLAPDPEGQVRAMRAAYKQAGWDPRHIDLIECHGAGTPVGDATELVSLRTLWDNGGGTPGGCAIGSVKSNIGHTLTAAGAAGMIKVLMALHGRTLPPSLNFREPAGDRPVNNPLLNGPFRVQTEPEPWGRRSAADPRRAAVSAFGFGGINAHVLLEEGPSPEQGGAGAPAAAASSASAGMPEAGGEPVAVVGMGAAVGPIDGLRAFTEAVFRGESAIGPRPKGRWKGTDALVEGIIGRTDLPGAFLESVAVPKGRFRIPPREIPDILPQQLLMLQVGADALEDAGMDPRTDRPRMGALIGIEFDPEATDYHVRWNLANEVRRWTEALGLGPEDADRWLGELRKACGPPLTAPRTLGALGGIVASRVAREFRFGGTSFGISREAASGLQALEIGVRAVRRGELDAVLVGAVDLAGDPRNVASTGGALPFSASGKVRPFDRAADGDLPGEGAVALVLKPLDRALADGDRVYAAIRGVGTASGSGRKPEGGEKGDPYLRSLRGALAEAGVSTDSVDYIEAHGSGSAPENRMEIDALEATFGGREIPRALGSLKPIIGRAGAVDGLAALVKAILCVYHQILPPLPGYTEPGPEPLCSGTFHVPAVAQPWVRDRVDGPRRAVVGSITIDGDAAHVIVEGMEETAARQPAGDHLRELRKPLGSSPFGLFPVEGEGPRDLLEGLDQLSAFFHRPDLFSGGVESAARAWHAQRRRHPSGKPGLCLLLGRDFSSAGQWIAAARTAVERGLPSAVTGPEGVAYNPSPLGPDAQTAFVFPGSGNHYVGMGRAIGVRWPELLREMDAATERLRTQMLPGRYMPWRNSWSPGWEEEARRAVAGDPLVMIFGQVVHGGLLSNLVRRFGIEPDAAIGYSLGESAGYFALGAWPERGEMLRRMRGTDLFTTRLAGPCRALRQAWNLPAETPVHWKVAVVNRPADRVREAIDGHPHARLLIINTPDECVIGGLGEAVAGVVRELRCDAFYLDGVVTVHCDAAAPAADAYRDLHRFPTHPPPGVRFYSCALGRAQTLTTESAADSILRQALHGFDFPAAIRQAHRDGVRIFLEMGPGASCTRMIRRILAGKPHLAVSACVRGEDDELTVLKLLAALAAEGVPVDFSALYGAEAFPPEPRRTSSAEPGDVIRVPVGGVPPSPPPPPEPARRPDLQPDPRPDPAPRPTAVRTAAPRPSPASREPAPRTPSSRIPEAPRPPAPPAGPAGVPDPYAGLLSGFDAAVAATAKAHEAFLGLSNRLAADFRDTFGLQAELLERTIQETPVRDGASWADGGDMPPPVPPAGVTAPRAEAAPCLPATAIRSERGVAFPRPMCMEFAVGSVAKVLGPAFAEVDAYPVRVRLPNEPLMLVDRILSVEGEKGALGSGRVVTEHDVLPGAWYLDGDRAPVCISVEAGQADLFLCSYLGIDLRVKGKRAYRLLDAKVRFHRGLPEPGDVIRYEIAIDRFVRQGETWLFFFRFEGTIGGDHLITMRDGCAGFFTEGEVERSGGIILTAAERAPAEGRKETADLVPVHAGAYDDEAVAALRRGDLAAAFGPDFEGIAPARSLWLPGGRMTLIHRIETLDPLGGRYGVGLIRAEADIHPDDWFLICHFPDDMVMPGTLMYECCAHTLRVFLQRIGWVTDDPEVRYEPVVGTEAVLKCRGPVTPKTRKVVYEVEIKTLGYGPEPFAEADAHMYADGRRIVMFTGMTLKLSGADRASLEAFWRRQGTREGAAPSPSDAPPWDRDRLLAFCTGRPSEAFGEPYRVFDRERVIARLPRPPYFFMDRVVRIDPEPWVLQPDGWIEAEYDIPGDDWYFRADRTGTLPFAVLLEIALQPCGWLAAYAGSALRSAKDLKFRNLGGEGTVRRPVGPGDGTLTMRARLAQAAEAGEMIIEHFDFQVLLGEEMVYEGRTNFGFFTQGALAQQVGIRGAAGDAYVPDPDAAAQGRSHRFADAAPLAPDDGRYDPARGLAMPAKALRMIDEIALYLPDGGPHGLGFIRGIKRVDPEEWFFDAHFYQDPVCPGSLGVESFLQLLKFAAMERWPQHRESRRFVPLTDRSHRWTYRGQILRTNREVTVEAVITGVTDGDVPTLTADGYLKVDGLFIYHMEGFGLKLVPNQEK